MCRETHIRFFYRGAIVAACLGMLILCACQVTSTVQPAIPTNTPLSPSATATIQPSSTPTSTHTLTPTVTPTITYSPTPSLTSTPSITPTYAILRGKVLVRSNCRYGPGAPYLYYVGLRPGTTMEVIGRNDAGTWVLIQGVGDNRHCWIKASLMEIQGEVMSVQPTYPPLPLSPYYRPPTGVSATRQGDEVTILWHGFNLRPGDETASAPFLVETWTCISGQLVFTPIGTYATSLTVMDEAGCDQPSHALVYIVEKHGYTKGVEVPWPAHK